MTLRLAINGFGRVGRCVLRALHERHQQLGSRLQVVAINELAVFPVVLSCPAMVVSAC